MARRIKIVHVADKFGVKGSSVHGVSRLFSWWMNRFHEDRYDVELVGLRPADTATQHLQELGVSVSTMNRSKFDVRTVSELVSLIRSREVDILHLHGYGATNFGRLAARLTGIKSIVHEHFFDPSLPKYQIPVDFLLSRYTDAGIAVSRSVKRFMVDKRYIPEAKTSVIYNGAPLDRFKPRGAEAVAEERQRWMIPDGCHVIATIGRLDEQKGNRYFIEAVAKVIGQGFPVKAVLVGDGPLLGELQRQSQKLGIEKDTIFAGFQADIPRIQTMVDIQVFPSLWEGTPLTLYEAMSMGRAIVSTTVDGLGEVLSHKKTAYLVPAKDPDALAEGIISFLAKPDFAQEIARNALQESSKYDIQETVNQIEEVYETLVETGE